MDPCSFRAVWCWAAVVLGLCAPSALTQDVGSTADRPFVFFTPGLAIIDRDTDHDTFFNSIDSTLVIPFSPHTSAVATYSLQFNDKPRWSARGNYDWFAGRDTTIRVSLGLIDDELGARAVAFRQRRRLGTGLRLGVVGGDLEAGAFVSLPLAWGFPLRSQSASERLRGRNKVTDLGAATAVSFSFRGSEPDLGTEPVYFYPRDAEWPRFGQSPQGQAATPAGLPPKLFQAWVADTGGPVRSSAAIADNTAYIGSDDGYLYALDLETGDLRWKYRLGAPIASSPAVTNGRVFVGCDDGAIYCFDMKADKRLADDRLGRQLWRYRTDGAVVGSPLVTASGLVVVGSTDATVYALDAKSAKIVWTYKTGGPVSASLVKSEALLRVINPDTGKMIKWDVVYCASEDGSIYALAERTGTLLWRVSTGAPIISTPTVYDRKVIVGNQNGAVLALDGANGRQLWAQTVRGEICGSLTIADKRVIVPQGSGRLLGLNVTNGDPVWTSELPDKVVSTPAAVQGTSLFVGCTDGNLYSVDRRTGKAVWSFQTAGPITASAAIAHGMLVCGSEDGAIYAFASKARPASAVVRHTLAPHRPLLSASESKPGETKPGPTALPLLVPTDKAWTPPPGWLAEPSAKKAATGEEAGSVSRAQASADSDSSTIHLQLISEPADAAELPIQLTSRRITTVAWGTTAATAEVDGKIIHNQSGQITIRKTFAADGTYPVTIITDKGTPREQVLCRLVIVSTSKEPSSARAVAFSPDGDGIGDTIAFRASADTSDGPGIAARILDVRDRSGRAVRTWSAPGGSENTFVWDGKDLTGKPAPAGRYILIYTAKDKLGRVRRMKQPIILQRSGQHVAAATHY